MSDRGTLRIGTAGWSIPGDQAISFPGTGPHLERYAQRISATEINSSFHRSHQPRTYSRWAASVPSHFRFAAKLPRDITHIRKLVATDQFLEQFLGEIQHLGDKLGPLLIQLPPSLAFVEDVASGFFRTLRTRHGGDLVCEPRHPTWFSALAEAVLVSERIARVAADPTCVPAAAQPGGWPGIVYRRLHGSPRMYSSAYSLVNIDEVASEMRLAADQQRSGWCIFDNTMHGEATRNALQLAGRLEWAAALN